MLQMKKTISIGSQFEIEKSSRLWERNKAEKDEENRGIHDELESDEWLISEDIPNPFIPSI